MNARMNAAMLEAARLTRAGQLLEATETLQRLLRPGEGPGPAAHNPTGGAETPIEGEFYVIGAEGPGTAPINTDYFQLSVPKNVAHPTLATLFVAFMATTTVSLAQLRSRFHAPQPPTDWRVQPLSG